MTPEERNEIEEMIDTALRGDFERKIGDTPTDALQLTPKKYVDAQASVYASSILTETNKRIVSRVSSIVSDSAITINTDTTDGYKVQALATNTVFTFTGTPTDQQKLLILMKDNNVQRTLGWPVSVSNYTATIPSVTTTSSVMVIGLIYDYSPSVWGCVLS